MTVRNMLPLCKTKFTKLLYRMMYKLWGLMRQAVFNLLGMLCWADRISGQELWNFQERICGMNIIPQFQKHIVMKMPRLDNPLLSDTAWIQVERLHMWIFTISLMARHSNHFGLLRILRRKFSRVRPRLLVCWFSSAKSSNKKQKSMYPLRISS